MSEVVNRVTQPAVYRTCTSESPGVIVATADHSHAPNPVAEWVDLTESPIGNLITAHVERNHAPMMNNLRVLAGKLGQPVYIAGGEIISQVPAFGMTESESRDVDVFVPAAATTQVVKYFQDVAAARDGELVVRPSRGDPNRLNIQLFIDGHKYEITPYDGEFRPYAQKLISGQIALEVGFDKQRVLSGYSLDSRFTELGFLLPLEKENLADPEWIWSSLRYMSECCMHSGIAVDPLAIEIIRERFDRFNVVDFYCDLFEQSGPDGATRFEKAFREKLREAFDRILNSSEKDTMEFILLLGQSHFFRRLIPATWLFAHRTQPSESIYSQLRSIDHPTYLEFEKAVRRAVSFEANASPEVFKLAGLDRAEFADSQWLMSPCANALYAQAAEVHVLEELTKHTESCRSIFSRYGIDVTTDAVVAEMLDFGNQFYQLRAIHIWRQSAQYRRYHHFPEGVISTADQIIYSEVLTGEYSDLIVPAYIYYKFMIEPRLESFTDLGQRESAMEVLLKPIFDAGLDGFQRTFPGSSGHSIPHMALKMNEIMGEHAQAK